MFSMWEEEGCGDGGAGGVWREGGVGVGVGIRTTTMITWHNIETRKEQRQV